MEINLKDLSPEALNHLKGRLLTIARDYEPWADMMYWSGGGDHGVYNPPFNLDEIERIDITMVGAKGPQESFTSSP